MSDSLWMLQRKKEPLLWVVQRGVGPLLATALHAGHAMRSELAELTALDEATRQREEDPYTAFWTQVGDTRIIPLRSRFEVDLNRPRAEAVYRKPENAWSLKLWKQAPSTEMIKRSLEEYDDFYRELRSLLADLQKHSGHFVVFDLHSYNIRRGGPDGPEADPTANPEVNIGTGTMDREYWASLVERFLADLRAYDFLGRHLDVRENVKFSGRQFPTWIHSHFPRSACVLSIEFKKFFMDEWTGKVDRVQLKLILDALRSTVPGLMEELAKR